MHLSVKAWHNLKAIVKVYLLGMLFFSFFRLAVILTNVDSFASDYSARWKLLKETMLAGICPDNAISCLIILAPAIIMSLLLVTKSLSSAVINVLYVLMGGVFIVSFLYRVTDISILSSVPGKLYSRLLCGYASMTPDHQLKLTPVRFWIFMVLFLIGACFYGLLLYRVAKKHKQFLLLKEDQLLTRHYALFIPLMACVWIILYLGTRSCCWAG